MYGLFPGSQARRLISIGFSAILALLLIHGAVSLSQLRAVNEDLDRVVAITNAKIASAYVMRDAIRQRSIMLRNARITEDPFLRDEYAMYFSSIASKFREARERLLTMEMDEHETLIHKELTAVTNASQPYNDLAMELILDEAAQESISTAFTKAATMQQQLLDLLGQLIQLEEQYAEKSRAKSQDNYRKTEYLMVALTMLIFIVGIAIALYIVRLSTKSTERIQYQASHDSLTGLINRREFEIRLSMAIHTARTERVSHALLYLDLDEFKIVNDSGGHIAGDKLLQTLPDLFYSVVRKGDTVARLGGDEFGILLLDCDPDQALLIAEKVREVIARNSFAWENMSFSIGASIGLVVIDEKSDDVNSVLRHADIACYAAKDQGKNKVYVFKIEDINIIRHNGQMQWASILKDALTNKKLTIYLQPIQLSGLSKGEPAMKRYEVLIRLKGKDGEIIEPRKFIPAAERYHMMPEVDRWVVKQIFKLCPGKEENSDINPLLSVNLSSDSLCNSDFMAFLESHLSSHPQFAKHLCFEIKERLVINKLQYMDNVISRLKRYGCKVSIDEFGAGISSLYYLKNLNIDYVKIEGAFVRDVLSDEVNHELISIVTKFCHKLGIDTIAEFVENHETLEAIRSLGVDYAQGYAIGKPLPCDKYLNPVLFTDNPEDQAENGNL